MIFHPSLLPSLSWWCDPCSFQRSKYSAFQSPSLLAVCRAHRDAPAVAPEHQAQVQAPWRCNRSASLECVLLQECLAAAPRQQQRSKWRHERRAVAGRRTESRSLPLSTWQRAELCDGEHAHDALQEVGPWEKFWKVSALAHLLQNSLNRHFWE